MSPAPKNTTKNTADVIVVGAGHNGLVSAAYLAQAGLDVLVVEASPTVGGMTSTNPFEPEAPGYTINEASMQASLFRTTTIDKDLGLSRKFGLKQTVIDPAHVQLNYDGTSLAMWRDPRRTADELRYFSPSDAEALLDLYRVIDAAVEIGLPLMQTSPVKPDIKKVLQATKGMVKNRKELVAVGRWMASSQAEAIEDSFTSDAIKAPLLIALPFMPFDADLSGWSLIYLGVLSKYGVSMFHGGTGALPAALVESLKSNGGRVRTSAPVDELVMHNGRVTGVRLVGGEEIHARRGVLTACSPKTTLTRLLPEGTLPRVLQNKADKIPTRRRGIADYKLNIALSGKITMEKHEKWRGDGIDLRLGCNSFNTYQESLDAAKACIRGDVPEHIPGLGHATTSFDKGFAPDGCDIFWFWTGLTPSDPREGWEVARDKITERVIRDASHYYNGIESLEVARRPLALPDIEDRFWAIDGSVYHVDPVISRFGPLKPADKFAGYSTPIPGLYLTGAGTHPVAGISGMPGQNAARVMLKEFRKEDGAGLGDRLRSGLVREKTLEARYEKAVSAAR
ncbi:phytoene desaturase family protein [Gordonia westfalica]|uniref:Pyridine nucleotide-disulfide oxidoreductase domain-containing protein 2 n=1 Tax=Gordonia westfalica TaxID=158898 RepID=A0A1H2KLC0_9ACTN|nr:NAD(P)/FAD-dependent oxidoreductase [Gordonia westfalica]SDU69372.1 Phytoene dehydrogenase-related protein [Gordonia westfalica]